MTTLQNLRVRWLDGALGVCVEDPGGPIVFIQWERAASGRAAFGRDWWWFDGTD